MNALVYEWRSVSPQSRPRVSVLSDRYESMWQAAIEDAVNAGVLRGDPTIIKRSVLGAMNLTVQWYRPEGRLDPAAFVEALLEATLPALPPGAGKAAAECFWT